MCIYNSLNTYTQSKEVGILRVIDLDKVEVEKRIGGIFVGGTVTIKPLVDKSTGSKEVRAALVTFSPGAKTKMHTHDHEQILYILDGKGIVATEQEERIATPGMVFLIPAGEKHWHGATKECRFSHLFIYNVATQTSY